MKNNTPGKVGFLTFPGERGSPETNGMDDNFSHLDEFFAKKKKSLFFKLLF